MRELVASLRRKIGGLSAIVHMKQKRSRQLKCFLGQCNSPRKALQFFRGWRRATPVDSFAVLFTVKACAKLQSAVEGEQMHALVICLGFDAIVFLQTALLKMYSSTGNLSYACRMFGEMSQRNVICWTAMISAYVDNGKPRKAVELFLEARTEHKEPDPVMVTVALSACADSGYLEMGRWVHSLILHTEGFRADLVLKNALINMYAKCGDISFSRRLFDSLTQKDVTTWTSMIVSHALHGQAEEALKLFSRLEYDVGCPVPNEITFIGVMMACSHAGLLAIGLRYLGSMVRDYGLTPGITHYGCITDLLCREGLLEEALNFTRALPIQPNAVIWRTLLYGCSMYGNVEIGAYARERLLELEPENVTDSITMSNIFAGRGMWEEKWMAREHTATQRRCPGCSFIEVEGRIHEFRVGDKSHPQKNEIYFILEGMQKNLTEAGYTPNVSKYLDFNAI